MGFNEAAANGRGNGRDRLELRPPASGFNEAAANGRGNLDQNRVLLNVEGLQ